MTVTLQNVDVPFLEVLKKSCKIAEEYSDSGSER